jgi:hypothetical protein
VPVVVALAGVGAPAEPEGEVHRCDDEEQDEEFHSSIIRSPIPSDEWQDYHFS